MALNDFFPGNNLSTIKTKICLWCGEEKPITDFPKHVLYKDKLDTRCRACIKAHSKVTSYLKKIAPPKPKVCECCGLVPRKWCLDHDHTTNTFRGWLCDKCTTGLGKLGDNIEGLKKGLEYLIRTTKIVNPV